MKIEVIGSRGYPASYASAEDLVREFGPRFVRDKHDFTVHCWATPQSKSAGTKRDEVNGIKRVFHSTPGGKVSGQFFVALKSSISAAFSDCDLVFYIFINSAIFCWLPRLFGKKVFVNVDGQMWKDPKWPWGIRQVFFVLGAYLAILFANKVITDSFHMKELYKKKFRVNIDWVGYGCFSSPPVKKEAELSRKYEHGYYLIMSRITPHNLTDLMVDGFINSGSKSHLLIAGHLPNTKWFHSMKKRCEGKNVTFLGLVKDQDELNQIILNVKAYLHGHSLGGINPALVRVTGMSKPVLCIDTLFNREVVQYPNGKLQARVFTKNVDSVVGAIQEFEANEELYIKQAKELGAKIRETMSWDIIYSQYSKLFHACFVEQIPVCNENCG